MRRLSFAPGSWLFILIIDQRRAVSKTAMGKMGNGEERLKSAVLSMASVFGNRPASFSNMCKNISRIQRHDASADFFSNRSGASVQLSKADWTHENLI